MRTLFVRSFQSVIALATVALLTGANDAGCGLGTVINGGTGGGSTTGTGTPPIDPPPPIACPDGMVVQLVCDPVSSGSGGGVIPIAECTGPDCPPPPPPCDPSDPNCSSPPYPGDPPPACDPSDPSCVPPSPGDAGLPPQCDPDDPNCSSPPPPPPQCDPADPNCPPSFPPPGCSFQCVPDQACPPGTDAVTVCVDNGGSGSGGGGDSGSGGSFGGEPPPDDAGTPVSNVTCWTECAPHGCGGDTPSEPPIPD